MNLPDLNLLTISISKLKGKLPEIVLNKETKIIVKNNEPVSAIMPYEDYLQAHENIENSKKKFAGLGQDITLNNGVQMMVVMEIEPNGDIATKYYVKLKTSGDYKLHYTFRMSPPNKETALTIEELTRFYSGEFKLD